MSSKNITVKSTDNLITELSNSCILKDFLKQNEAEFIRPDLGSAIQELLKKKNIGKAVLAKRSGMSTVYLYQLLNGKRHPSRDRLLCLCIGLNCTIDEAQELLSKSGYSHLYLKIRRDAIIAYGLNNAMDINRINDLLYENKEETLI